MTQWYAVRSATRQEPKALKALTEQGFAVFLPCETRHRRLGGAQEAVHRPLFPGYMFVLCDVDHFRQVLEVEGVHQFVRFGTGDNLKPFAFPASEIIKLQTLERAGEFDYTRAAKPVPYRPRKGDKVQVTAGPWMTYIGRVLSTPTKDRVHVKLEGPYGGKGQTLDVSHLAAA